MSNPAAIPERVYVLVLDAGYGDGAYVKGVYADPRAAQAAVPGKWGDRNVSPDGGEGDWWYGPGGSAIYEHELQWPATSVK
jgi:hypothetical protein